MRTTELRYVGSSPSRQVPGIGRVVRGEWLKVEGDGPVGIAERLVKQIPNQFEMRDKAPVVVAKKGAPA